jgi:hypothetical protein
MKYRVVRPLFYYCLLPIAYCLLLSSCKTKKDSFITDYQYDYAPIDSGHYVIYDVDSISYSYIEPLQIRDTAHYQMKEEVGDTVYFNNELNYELNLYRRADENSPWVYDRKWDIKRTTTTFQKEEGNIRFVKLVFPPAEGEEWAGNIYVPTETDPYKGFLDWDYHYENMGTPSTINNINFDSTLTVVEVNDSNVINKRLRKEVYAKGVGMIYQEWELLNKQDVLSNWQTGRLNGFRIRMKVRDHN